MGSPFETEKSAETYERVVSAAMRIFKEKGFQSTTMRDIAREGKLSLGSLYYYFQTKEELVLLFYERLNQEVEERFRKQYLDSGHVSTQVDTFLKIKLEMLAPYRELVTVILKEAVDPESKLSPLSNATTSVRSSVLRLFEEMIVLNKGLQNPDIQQEAKTLWLVHLLIMVYWLHDKSIDYNATNKVLDLLKRGIEWISTMRMIPGFNAITKQIFSILPV